jgi:predicted phosphodiesterase
MTDNTMSEALVEVVDSNTNETMTFTGSSQKVAQYFTKNNSSKVALSGLKPGTTYQYRLVNRYVSPKSKITFSYYSDYFSFTTEASAAQPFTFIHMADSQSSPVSAYAPYWGNTLQKAVSKIPDARFIVHTGDMVESSSQSNWEAFFGAAGINLSSAAFMPVHGNHEGSLKSTSEPFSKAIFNVDSQNGFALNYSYTYGNALFINLNSNYTSKAELERQGQWIRNEVAAKGQGKFLIVSFHKAPYGGGHSTDSDVRNIEKYLVPTLEQVGADLVLQGHDHSYIRSYPTKNGVPNTKVNGSLINTSQDGVIYMMSRNSGQKTYSVASKKAHMNVLWNHNPERTSVDATMFSAISVEDDKIVVKAYTSDYRIIDEYTLVQDEAIGAVAPKQSVNPLYGYPYFSDQMLPKAA